MPGVVTAACIRGAAALGAGDRDDRERQQEVQAVRGVPLRRIARRQRGTPDQMTDTGIRNSQTAARQQPDNTQTKTQDNSQAGSCAERCARHPHTRSNTQHACPPAFVPICLFCAGGGGRDGDPWLRPRCAAEGDATPPRREAQHLYVRQTM